MMKKLRYIKALFLLAPFMLACEKDDIKDTIPPTAQISLPTENTTYYRGNTLMFTGQFNDDIELKECTFYLSQGLKATKGWDDPWLPDAQTFPLAGKEDELIEQYLFALSIPQDIMSGDYVLKVLTVDQALNYSTTEIPIQIK